MRDTDDYFERLLLFRDTSSDIAITLPAEASVEFLWLKAELSSTWKLLRIAAIRTGPVRVSSS
jgi:hypothetical protein